mmetsp:Transcript_8333/g.51958  ORF Transcript_8333/g.51958 Transcript_8333/m.51958 type:complete len:243 (-) Transcript_8333:15-743(-)
MSGLGRNPVAHTTASTSPMAWRSRSMSHVTSACTTSKPAPSSAAFDRIWLAFFTFLAPARTWIPRCWSCRTILCPLCPVLPATKTRFTWHVAVSSSLCFGVDSSATLLIAHACHPTHHATSDAFIHVLRFHDALSFRETCTCASTSVDCLDASCIARCDATVTRRRLGIAFFSMGRTRASWIVFVAMEARVVDAMAIVATSSSQTVLVSKRRKRLSPTTARNGSVVGSRTTWVGRHVWTGSP